MAALYALLSQQQSPSLQTNKALIVLGLQNDFLLPDGKLPVRDSRFVDRIYHLIPAFRKHGTIIWVRSEYRSNRAVNDEDGSEDSVVIDEWLEPGRRRTSSSSVDTHLSKRARTSPTACSDLKPRQTQVDEELFLTDAAHHPAACVSGSHGAEYCDQAVAVQTTADLHMVKTHYSAFISTSLLVTLRSKLITELYICGCMTNLSVYATAMDAACYGVKITLVEDCLGYRRRGRHELAVDRLRHHTDANIMSSSELSALLQRMPSSPASNNAEDMSHTGAARTANVPLNSSQYLANVLELDNDDDDDDEIDFDSDPDPTWMYPLNQDLQGLRLSSRHASPVESGSRTSPPTAVVEDTWSSKKRGSSQSRHDRSKDIAETDNSASAIIKRAIANTRSTSLEERRRWLGLGHVIDGGTSIAQSSHRGMAAMSTVIGLDQSVVSGWEREKREKEEQSTRQMQSVPAVSRQSKSQPLFGENFKLESAGSRIHFDFLEPDLADDIFARLTAEVDWQRMYHHTGEVPRLVCCQATVGAHGSMPVYRHPSDQTLLAQPWTPTVDHVRRAAEHVIGHPLNHALIQLYRGGNDYISEHSDKTLDIAPDTCIVNVSFGAQRTMRLRTKRAAPCRCESKGVATVTTITTAAAAAGAVPDTSPRQTFRVPMPHNSLLAMTLPTNAAYLHGINADKRPAVELSAAEEAYGGQRISITFRRIGTFLGKDGKVIWGQGATGKTREQAREVRNADEGESARLLAAFGRENQVRRVMWEEIYGGGSDVLHLR